MPILYPKTNYIPYYDGANLWGEQR